MPRVCGWLKVRSCLRPSGGQEMESLVLSFLGAIILRREHYTASINRFRVVVEDFQATTTQPKPLHRLFEPISRLA